MLIFTAGLATAQIRFERLSLRQALHRAAKERKLVFVYLYTGWCTPCKELDSVVFADSAIRDLISGRFVSLKLDAAEGEGRRINAKYRLNEYPAFLFFNASGKKVGQILGMLGNEEYLAAIREIAQKARGRP